MKGFREYVKESTLSADVPQAVGQITPSNKKTEKNTTEMIKRVPALPGGTFAGGPYFEVDLDTFTKCQNGKPPRKWWDTSTKTTGMKQFVESNPKQSPVWIKWKNYYHKLR